MLGVQALVLGSFSAVGQMVRIDARFAEVETGRILGAEEVSGETVKFFELEQALAVKIVDGFRTRFPGREERPGKEGAGGARAGMAGPVGKRQPDRLAVFPFEDLGAPSGPGKWGEEIAAGLEGRLSGNREIEIVDRKRLRTILGGFASGAVGRPDEGAYLKAGGIAGADILVLGSFLVFDGRIKIHGRLVKTETGEVITAVRTGGKVGERSKLTERLGEKMLSASLK
jgi:TolB-like protein